MLKPYNQIFPTIKYCLDTDIDQTKFLPKRAHPTDAGFDIWITKLIKVDATGLYCYDTSISFIIPVGWMLEVVPRSSFTGCGYIMPNSPAKIDTTYRGKLQIRIRKIDSNVADLVLPICLFQAVPVRQDFAVMEQISQFDFQLADSTDRGQGGFGSTNSGSNK